MIKIGYPCINRSIGCSPNRTFRLASYSEEKLIEKVGQNLNCLKKILLFNAENHLFFFRISSDLIPFASHPVCCYGWPAHFRSELAEIGALVIKQGIRISMHPDQFVLLNSLRRDVVRNSILELEYHQKVLDLMCLGPDAKIQIHVGAVCGNKSASIQRFIDNYRNLSSALRERLVIENDDRLYSLKDCLRIYDAVGVPVLFDSLHHQCLNNSEDLGQAAISAAKTWQEKDGRPMFDYSQQAKGSRPGKHAESIDIREFGKFIDKVKGLMVDIMLEIKDKESSALEALRFLKARGLC